MDLLFFSRRAGCCLPLTSSIQMFLVRLFAVLKTALVFPQLLVFAVAVTFPVWHVLIDYM